EQIAPRLGHLGIGREEGIAVDLLPIPAAAIDRLRSDLDEGAANLGGLAGHMLDDLAGDGAGRHAACRLPRRGAAAAAIVPQPVFGPIGVVGMARPELVLDLAVVL